MKAALPSSSFLHLCPCPHGSSLHPKMGFNKRKNPCTSGAIRASKRDAHDHRDYDYDYNCDGRLVDDNMIVLRKRIQEMKMAQRNWEAPSDWMEWEKQYYYGYNSDICEAMRFLQSLLMNTRPSLALGMLLLLALSLPTSAALIILYLKGRFL